MPPLLRFLLGRLVAIPITLLVITAMLYGITMLAPAEVRAQIYLSRVEKARGNVPVLSRRVIERYGLNDPYPVQYVRWVSKMLTGDWGYSPVVKEDVLPGLLVRTPATVELALFAVLLFVPLGLVGGVLAGWREGTRADYLVRAAAFVATSVPPFVVGLALLAIFYAGLRWFPPERLGAAANAVVDADWYRAYTGLLTIDGLLNGRLDVSLDALRHLVLPAVALALAQWATLVRITRVTTIEEVHHEYVVAAQARGLRERAVIWGHVFPNAVGPALTSSALASAALLTGVFSVEVVFGWHGVSELVTIWTRNRIAAISVPDTSAILGFAVYSVLAVQALMLALDVIQVLVNPRLREGIGER